MQENWDRISHTLSNHYKGHGYKRSLFKNISYLRTEMTDRSETRIVLGVPTELERGLIQRTIAPDISQEVQKLVLSQFTIEFEITGEQITFPAPVIDQEPELTSTVAHLPIKMATSKKVVNSTDFTLAETIRGEENRMLIKAIEQTLNEPQEVPFPLLVTGESGAGKSHHAKTLWTELRNRHDADRVKLITGEKFLTDFLEHIKTKQTWKFQKKYRHETDVLVIDDISCLKGAKKTQEEFLAVLDHFHSYRKIIVVTLPCHPSELIGLEPAIVSRLTSGLHIELKKPYAEFRRKFIKNQFDKFKLNIEMSCVELICDNTRCFREIKGYVNKINFLFAGRTDVIPTREITSYVQFANPVATLQTPEEILNLASTRFKVDVKQLISKSRVKKIVTARNYAICMMRDKLGLSLQEIGRHVGHRDHSTIRHAIIKSAGTETARVARLNV